MLGPDLRVAVVSGDEQTSRRLRLAPGTNGVSHLLQNAVGACLAATGIQARIDQAREDYARRREAMATALAEQGIRAVARTIGQLMGHRVDQRDSDAPMRGASW